VYSPLFFPDLRNFLYPVGLALREQVLEKGNIPMGDNDWSMDFVITPDEVLTNPTPVSRGVPQL
jgi:5-formyltetrahydrofolate cyclo-ligase